MIRLSHPTSFSNKAFLVSEGPAAEYETISPKYISLVEL